LNNHPGISQERLELIERYLLGQMAMPEIADFESKLQSDHLLKQQVEEQKLLMLAIEESMLRTRLDGFHKGMRNTVIKDVNAITLPHEYSQPAVVKKMPWKKWLSVAAIFTLLAFSAWWVLLKPTRDQQLFANYYQPDPGLMTAMGSTEEYDFNRAMIDYKSGHYDSAIASWTRQLSVNPGSDTLQYFIASAQLANKNFTGALKYFEAVIQQPASPFFAEANWYAALAAIQAGDKTRAAKFLSQSNRPEKERLRAELNQ
jgi:hypothetical protein